MGEMKIRIELKSDLFEKKLEKIMDTLKKYQQENNLTVSLVDIKVIETI